MARLHPRLDANHHQIVDALRRAGARVQSLAAVGGGCPDLLVAFRGAWYVLEIKDGDKPPSHRALTLNEGRWHADFGDAAPIFVVASPEEALRVIGAL